MGLILVVGLSVLSLAQDPRGGMVLFHNVLGMCVAMRRPCSCVLEKTWLSSLRRPGRRRPFPRRRASCRRNLGDVRALLEVRALDCDLPAICQADLKFLDVGDVGDDSAFLPVVFGLGDQILETDWAAWLEERPSVCSRLRLLARDLGIAAWGSFSSYFPLSRRGRSRYRLRGRAASTPRFLDVFLHLGQDLLFLLQLLRLLSFSVAAMGPFSLILFAPVSGATSGSIFHLLLVLFGTRPTPRPILFLLPPLFVSAF
mmetsp:Transcript_28531/g.62252  ORF Transcript_28531/g.62252 Transcript_28531/m.62252 type:complete len:257 (-) Transcript_28531:316-1086(-)